MRRAGYEVRVLPEEDLGWEENPPTLIEFIRRDLRWCQGNCSIWQLPAPAGPASRQPLSARLRHPDVPRLARLDRRSGARHARARARRRSPAAFMRADAGLALLVRSSWSCGSRRRSRPSIDVLLRADRRARASAARVRFLAGVATEIVFSLLLLADHVARPHAVHGRPAVRPRHRLDRPDARRPLRAAGARPSAHLWPHAAVGARRARARSPRPIRPPFPMRCCSPAASALADSASPSSPPRRASAPCWRASASAGCRRRSSRRRCCAPWRCRRSTPRAVRLTHAGGLRTARGIAALAAHLLRRRRRAARRWTQLYARFVKPGDLVFDIGAHVGDRVAAFRRLGARVVALEPQPALARRRCACSTAATAT